MELNTQNSGLFVEMTGRKRMVGVKSRKVAFIAFGVSFGGTEVYLRSLTRLLKDQVEMYALCVNPELAEVLRREGVRVFEFPFALHRGKLLQILLGAMMLPYLRLRYGVDSVWINGYTEIVLLPLARLLGCAALATRHLSFDPYSQSRLRYRVSRSIYEHFAFAANKIFCVSEAVAHDMRTVVDENRLAVIPNWVPALPTQVSSRSGDKLHLLFVGRLQAHKGAALILEAMRQMQSNGGADRLALTIVGDGECRADLESLAQGLDVRFAGFQKDPSPYYREADVFINPSLGPEGLPLVSLEAMSYGLPCIFSDLRVHREITSNGEAALLFRSEDAAELRSRIEYLLESEEARQQYGERARAAILANHSPETARGAYLRQLETAFGVS